MDWVFIYNSTFCPHNLFMCFVWIWEQTAIISLYSINWPVFITEENVYCAVGTGSLYIIIICINFSLLSAKCCTAGHIFLSAVYITFRPVTKLALCIWLISYNKAYCYFIRIALIILSWMYLSLINHWLGNFWMQYRVTVDWDRRFWRCVGVWEIIFFLFYLI